MVARKALVIGGVALVTTAAVIALVSSSSKASTGGGGATTNTGNLSGIVTDENTGDPIVGVTVTMEGTTIQTDTNGAFAITDIPVGEHAITFAKEGYKTVVL